MTATDLVPEVGEVTRTGRPPASRRTRVVRWAVLVVLLALAGLLASSVTSRDSVWLSALNPRPAGAQAAAEILRDRGVDVHVAGDLRAVLDRAVPGTTVLVTASRHLSEEAARQLADTGADLVLVAPTSVGLRAIGAPIESTGGGATQPVQADCADEDARAASRIGPHHGAVTATDGGSATVCFTDDDGRGAYAVWPQGGYTLRVLADGSLLSNERLDEDGHAALVLRALGHHEQLVWFAPEQRVGAVDLSGTTPPAAWSPRWSTYVGWAAGLAAVVLALALGRSLGPVIPEPLPVVVRAAETVRGRGALYRCYGATAHAGAGLRAGSAVRLSRRLGLPAQSHRTDLVDAVTAATGRSEPWVRDVLYGPPPTTDAELTRLATDLETLESEVHRT